MAQVPRGRADYQAPGDWNAICSMCGFKRKASTMVKNWQGFYRCPEHNEPRHPQDYIKAIPDNTAVPWAQPRGGTSPYTITTIGNIFGNAYNVTTYTYSPNTSGNPTTGIILVQSGTKIDVLDLTGTPTTITKVVVNIQPGAIVSNIRPPTVTTVGAVSGTTVQVVGYTSSAYLLIAGVYYAMSGDDITAVDTGFANTGYLDLPTYGSLTPTTYQGITILSLTDAYNVGTGLTTLGLAMAGNVAQGIFTSLEIDNLIVSSAAAAYVYDASINVSAWIWSGGAGLAVGGYYFVNFV